MPKCPELVRYGPVSRPILAADAPARVVLCPEMLANVGISAPRYFAQRWPDRKRRAVAECAAGRTVAEVAANIGAAPAEVERWCRQPDFAEAVRRYRFGWSPRRRAALALLVRDGPPWRLLSA